MAVCGDKTYRCSAFMSWRFISYQDMGQCRFRGTANRLYPRGVSVCGDNVYFCDKI